MRTLIEDEAVKMLLEQEFPFVVIGLSGYNNVIQIEHNHFEGCKELTSMLLMKNLKRIAVIGGSKAHMVTSSRINGYKAAHYYCKLLKLYHIHIMMPFPEALQGSSGNMTCLQYHNQKALQHLYYKFLILQALVL